MRYRDDDRRSEDVLFNTVLDGPGVNVMGTGARMSYQSSFTRKSGYRAVIEDVARGFGGENPCYHHEETWGGSSGSHYAWYDKLSGNLGQEGTYYGPPNLSPDFEQFNTANHPDTTSDRARWNIPDWSREAWLGCYPVIKRKLDLLNSIYELKDFKRLGPLYSQSIKGFKNAKEAIKLVTETDRKVSHSTVRLLSNYFGGGKVDAQSWSNLLKLTVKHQKALTGQQTIERLVSLGRLSAAHLLNYKFAVDPLLRDIEALGQVSSSLAAELQNLLRKADGTPQRRHWSRTLELSEVGGLREADLADSPFLGDWYSRHCAIRNVCQRPRYTFTITYSFTYSERARRLAYELARLDELGIHLSARNLWNAIPYSFMVDWFARVGDALDLMTGYHLEPILRLIGSSHSILYSQRSELLGDPWPLWRTNPESVITVVGCDPKVVAWKETKVYIRKSVLPALLSLPKTSDFSTMEKVLAMALGLSSVRYSTV